MIKYQQRIVMRLALLLGGAKLPNIEREEGQTLVEYAMILCLIAVVAATVVGALETSIGGAFSSIGSAI